MFIGINLFFDFALSDQNSDLAGHMPFQKKKIICSPVYYIIITISHVFHVMSIVSLCQ